MAPFSAALLVSFSPALDIFIMGPIWTVCWKTLNYYFQVTAVNSPMNLKRRDDEMRTALAPLVPNKEFGESQIIQATSVPGMTDPNALR